MPHSNRDANIVRAKHMGFVDQFPLGVIAALVLLLLLTFFINTWRVLLIFAVIDSHLICIAI